MQRRQFVFAMLKRSLLGTAACALPGCGTLFHSERIGQPHSRDIDWKIVALDGLGLLLFFVPGVIAFIVDFGTGAIYLPPEGMGTYSFTGPTPPESSSRIKRPSSAALQQVRALTWQELGFNRVLLPRGKLQPGHIEDVVTRETGCKVSLDDVDTRLSELPGINHYHEQLARHRRDRSFGHSVHAFFSQIMST